jgi:hypothetical protein
MNVCLLPLAAAFANAFTSSDTSALSTISPNRFLASLIFGNLPSVADLAILLSSSGIISVLSIAVFNACFPNAFGSILPSDTDFNNAFSSDESDDFSIAIQEGATHVRIGTAIFGARSY